MRHARKLVGLLVTVALLAATAAGMKHDAAAALPAGNAVQQWDDIATKTVVSSGAFQNEGLTYMAYVSAAMYDAVTSIQGTYKPVVEKVDAPDGASVQAAVVEAAYRTLVYYFPAPRTAASPDLDALYAEALRAVPDGPAKWTGIRVGATAAVQVIYARRHDGRRQVVASTSPFSPKPAAGVWRRTPPAYATPQTPWVGQERPFVLERADQFLPAAPPKLTSTIWVDQFNEIKALGRATGSSRTPEQTDIARFWSTNVIGQYNQAVRDTAVKRGLDLLETARLMAMVNIVGADAQIACMNAKYHYAFWRPVTAIDPSSAPPSDGGPAPGFDDGNPATTEVSGWRPLLATPNHPEYPAAHGSLTSAMAEVFTYFLNTPNIDLTLSSTIVPTMPSRHFATADTLRTEIVNARLWAGLHFRNSSEAGVTLGRRVARFDLQHAFQPVK